MLDISFTICIFTVKASIVRLDVILELLKFQTTWKNRKGGVTGSGLVSDSVKNKKRA